MGTYVGADWASNGWVAAELDESDELSVGFYPTIWNLWHDYEDEAEQILVDIPIGLPEEKRRDCDREAKDELGNRRSCVFWTPIRDAVYEDNVEDAKEIQEDKTGHRISNQAWAIVPRIREVDTFLLRNDDAPEIVRESHPEICFYELNGGPLPKKSSDDGLAERKDALDSFLEDNWEEKLRVLTEPRYARQSAKDDVLDAVALAVTAKRGANGSVSTLPEDPPEDEKDLPMEIVYPEV